MTTEMNIETRVLNLTPNALRAALFSIDNKSVLEDLVTAGENYQKLADKMKKQKEK
uniref:Uncharacterized protein n=1 Tax=viral metagenome TaxID=1070528 RepID=A0A6M3LBI5_9ZZZZ